MLMHKVIILEVYTGIARNTRNFLVSYALVKPKKKLVWSPEFSKARTSELHLGWITSRCFWKLQLQSRVTSGLVKKITFELTSKWLTYRMLHLSQLILHALGFLPEGCFKAPGDLWKSAFERCLQMGDSFSSWDFEIFYVVLIPPRNFFDISFILHCKRILQKVIDGLLPFNFFRMTDFLQF